MMTVGELNHYIKHYLEEDKTHTAIMLTGEWGSGKTYYVEKILVPFLQKEKKNGCIVISLYGLESLSDISKSIYMELRMKALDRDSEVLATGKLIAKTIAKGAAGIFGIDVNMSEEDLEKMYSSVDAGKADFIEADTIALRKLLTLVQGRIDSQNYDMDKIQVKQLHWLCGNLKTFISQMS